MHHLEGLPAIWGVGQVNVMSEKSKFVIVSAIVKLLQTIHVWFEIVDDQNFSDFMSIENLIFLICN